MDKKKDKKAKPVTGLRNFHDASQEDQSRSIIRRDDQHKKEPNRVVITETQTSSKNSCLIM